MGKKHSKCNAHTVEGSDLVQRSRTLSRGRDPGEVNDREALIPWEVQEVLQVEETEW